MGISATQLHAGGWTLPKGRLWLKSAIYYQSTSSRFCTSQDAQSLAFQQAGCSSAGHSAPFDPFIGGDVEALAVFTELAYGVTSRFELGVQVPFYSLQFTNLADPNRPTSESIGDVRFYAKYLFLQKPFVASFRVGAKSPTGKFNVDAEVVNVSEGQWDIEFFGEVSKSFWPLPVYASVGAGYRMRSDNDDFEHTLENELMVLAEAGINLSSRLLLKGTFDWLRGQRPKIKLTGDPLLWRRELMTLAPALSYQVFQDFHLEGAVRFPLRGRDFPDSPQFITSLSYSFPLLK
ncbi:MAG: hypothetical protein ACE5I1_03545 [bacterium]